VAAEGTEEAAEAAAVDMATGSPAGTMITEAMGGAITAREITIPMGKPKGVAALAACV